MLAGLKNYDESLARVNFLDTEDITIGRSTWLISDNKSEEQRAKRADEPNFDINYPFESSIYLASKLTVTGLKNLVDKEAESASWTKISQRGSVSFTVPIFKSKKVEKSAAERGTLLHHVMQSIDYKMCSCDSDVRKALQCLVDSGELDETEVKDIETDRIVKLFNTELGKKLSAAEKVGREFKFSILVPAGEYASRRYMPKKGSKADTWEADDVGGLGGGIYSEGCGCGAVRVESCSCDKILLQGIIDCFFEEGGELVLVDFKTDKVTKSTVDSRAGEYAPQLKAYASALERMTKKRVRERIVYFFEMDMAYVV
jgi:ATP-dependent helicase/nuclease subunit A